MVTLIKYGALSGGEKYNVNVLNIDGLSTDTKPTVTYIEYGSDGREISRMGIPNGSIFTEIDTGDTYMYDVDATTWHKVSIGGGGGGGFTPTTAQLDAMNSGIDSTKVEQIETNKNNILLIQAQVNNVTYLKYGINLFDKAVYKDGMFLGTNAVETANANYFISDYIYLYDASLDKLTWFTYNGAAVRFVAFYDSNKNYINNSWKQIGGNSQANTIDIPSNAVYVRISTYKNQLNTTQLEYGTSYSGYVPYIVPYYKLKIGNSIIVDKSGLGDYTTVTEAVANAKSGDVIYIYKGVYENEVIEAWGKNISLVGFDARNTIIRNSTDNYNTPPLEISVGSVSNLTFETIANAEPNVKSYAVHVEHDSLSNSNLTFTNCTFKAASNAAVGVGLRPNCIVEFNNCTFEVGNNLNALFFHDSANYSGIQTLICNCCKITAGNAQAIRIDDNNVSGTTMYIEFVNSLVRNMSNLSSNAVWFNNTGHESGSGIGGLTNTYLSDKSYGNSSAILNV